MSLINLCRDPFRVAAVWCLIAVISIPLRAQKAEPIDVIKVNTDLVVFDVQVLDRKTRSNIGNLTEGDFEIWDRGVKQNISYFSRDELPLSIMLLLDVSESVRPFIQRIRAGALEALQRLKPQDQVAVMAFASSSKLIQKFTLDRGLVAAQIDEATSVEKLGPLTGFAAAMDKAALEMLNPPPGTRSVIIVVTDNVFATSAYQQKILLAELFDSGSVVYGLLVKTSNPQAGLLGGMTVGVDRYVEQTGGEIFRANKRDIAEQLATLIQHLRLRYAIGYRPGDTTEDEKFRPVQITVSSAKSGKPKPLVLTRRGYYLRRRTN